MKKIILMLTLFAATTVSYTQQLANTKWTEYVLGGTKSFYTKTYTIKQDKLVQNQTGSGGVFDNKPTDISIEKFVTTASDERIINKYDDTTFMVIVFKNIDANKA